MTVKDYIPNFQFRYYYTQLPADEQNTYAILLNGLLSYSNEIKCPCSVGRIQEIYHMVRYDVPELFYVKTIAVRYSICGFGCTVLPTYRFSSKESIATLQALCDKYQRFISETQMLSPVDKEKAIHDLIVSMVKYKDLDAPYSHEAPGSLLFGIGVCEGISKAFKYLADRVELKSIVVIGTSNAHGNENGHAWNAVEIDNVYYHLDVTFDNTIADRCVRYDYFNLSDEEIKTNHSWEMQLPRCPSSFNYYGRIGRFFDCKSKLAGFIRRESKEGNIMVFQVPSFCGKQDDAVNAVRDIVQKNISCNLFGITRYSISYNTDRMVFQVQTESEGFKL